MTRFNPTPSAAGPNGILAPAKIRELIEADRKRAS